MGQKTKEETWTYPCQITLNEWKIEWLTITDYPLKRHKKDGITKELIRKLINNLPKEVEPQKGYKGNRVPFVEKVSHESKIYLLVFWFKNGSTNHLWVKNCYPCYKKSKKVNCFQCQEEVIVKYNYPRKDWTLINNWGYWTERKEDEEKYICNPCLKKLYYENKKGYWKTITNPSKRMRMRNHIYSLTK